MSTAICVGFFSPAGFSLPRQHLQSTLRALAECDAEVICAQVVRSGAEPELVPAGVKAITFQSDDILFFKENLWNLAAESSTADRLVFCDADVRFSNPYWLEQTERILDHCQVVQPYAEAAWLARDGVSIELVRESAGAALMMGRDPRPGISHPGFAWAMTRSVFDRIGGHYELHPAGGGDTAFSLALGSAGLADAWAMQVGADGVYTQRASYRSFHSRVRAAGIRVGAVAGRCLHSWHGDRAGRRYIGREHFMPTVGAGELPLQRRADGLLAWTDAAANERAAEYFRGRMEDG